MAEISCNSNSYDPEKTSFLVIALIKDEESLSTAISQKVFRKKPCRNLPLSSFITIGKAGGTPTSSIKDYYGGKIPFLSINGITKQGKYITHADNTLTQKGLDSSSAWMVPTDSLILSMYASVGLPAINKIPLATSQAMFSMVLRDKSQLDYLYYYLCFFKERYIYRYLETGTQSNINAEIVRSISIPDYAEYNVKYGSLLSIVDMRIYDETLIYNVMAKQKRVLLDRLFI